MPDDHIELKLSSSPANRQSTRSISIACALIAIVVIIYAGLKPASRDTGNAPLEPFASKGRQAPDFALPAPDGKVVQLSDYRGKAVLVNFFGTTCVPCRQESPHLSEMQKKNAPRGFEIIGIEMYGSSNDAIEKYRKEFNTPYILVRGNNAIGDRYGVGELPVSYYLNAKGTVVVGTVGLHSEKEMDSNLEAALRSN